MSQLGFGPSDTVGVPFVTNVPLTGAAITMQAAALVLNAAGTIATAAVTLPLNPPDGCVAEISTTQIITGLTVTANTGDSIVNGVLGAVTGLTPVASVGAGSESSTIKYKYSLNGALPVSAVTGLGANPRTWFRVS
jgi:hypothetical protein